MAFCIQLVSLGIIMFLRCNHVVACISNFFIALIKVYCLDISSLFIHSSAMAVWVVSTLGLWWIMLLWLFDYPCTNFCVNMFLLLLGMNLRVELLGHMVTQSENWMLGWSLSLPADIVGFPGGSDGKESACNSGDLVSIPGSGRSPGEGNGNPF